MSRSVRLHLLVPVAASLTLAACASEADDLDNPYHGGPVTCLTFATECSAFATCTYDPDDGSPRCACDFGFTGDGISCIKVPLCSEADYCDPNATCTAVEWSADVCTCNAGYQDDPDAPPGTRTGESCVEIDECEMGLADCDQHAVCTNLPGSFACACNGDLGYSEDDDPETKPGTVCVDTNECAVGLDDCDEHAVCTDIPGGFTCACGEGYIEDEDPTTPPGTVCTPEE